MILEQHFLCLFHLVENESRIYISFMAQQGLQLSQNMSLNQVLAPQLQQSLNLLQAPTLELKAMVDQELQVNPVLEEQAALDNEGGEASDETSSVDLAEPPSDTQYDSTDESEKAEPIDDLQKEMNQLIELDQEWREYFSSTNIPMRTSADEDEKRQFMIESVTIGQSLQRATPSPP